MSHDRRPGRIRRGPPPPHRLGRAAFRAGRHGSPILRPGRRAHAEPDRLLDRHRRHTGLGRDAADRRLRRLFQLPVVSVLQLHLDREGAARDRHEPYRRPADGHQATAIRHHRLPAGLAARRRLGRADRARQHHLLRFRLPHRAQGLRRRDHRGPRQLPGDGARLGLRRYSRKLCRLPEQPVQGSDRLLDPDPGAALALLLVRQSRGGGRGMSARATILIVAFAVLALLAAPFYLAPFTVTLLNYIGVYSFVALGLVLLTGVAGMVAFGQASFMGIAAYATAWTSALMGYSPWLGLILAIVVTCAVAAAVGLLTLRLQGHFLSLSTIAWGLALYFTFGNIAWLGAYNGIPSIPAPSLGSIPLIGSGQIFYLIWIALLLALLGARNLLGSRLGCVLCVLCGGFVLVESLGFFVF